MIKRHLYWLVPLSWLAMIAGLWVALEVSERFAEWLRDVLA